MNIVVRSGLYLLEARRSRAICAGIQDKVLLRGGIPAVTGHADSGQADAWLHGHPSPEDHAL
jgi:hypothetical protein